ncbi:MAG: GGDEF domain-containing protein [Gaiellaceae bacterium]
MKLRSVRTESSGPAFKPDGGAARSTVRLLPLIVPVSVGGAAALAAALWQLAGSSPSLGTLAGATALLLAALLAEAFPVPMEGLPGGYLSLAAVFIVGTALIYGWEIAAVLAFLTRGTLDLVERRPLDRFVYNGGVYALGGAAAGFAAGLVPDRTSDGALLLAVLLSAVAYYVVNIVLVAAVLALWSREPLGSLLGRSAYWTAAPFGIMASVSLILDVLWSHSPPIAAALVGPLLAVALYQRSTHRALAATRLALTDPLTGLGNHRHFQEQLQRGLDDADAQGLPLALCMIDVDDFKRINDTYGHPVGDEVLTQVASSLRQGGEAFRLGGDEFALVLTGNDAEAGLEIAERVSARLRAITYGEHETVGVSIGVGAYPTRGVERTELLRLTDAALYRAKRAGKNTVHAIEPAPQLAVATSL